MAWFLLVVAGLFEVAWATLLEDAQGFSRLVPTVGFLVTLGLSMYLLSIAVRTIPIGTGYAVWVGIGAAGAYAVSLIRGASTSTPQALAMGALIASIVAVRLTAPN